MLKYSRIQSSMQMPASGPRPVNVVAPLVVKLYRCVKPLNDDGSIPNDNPFGGQLAKYYAYGVRNSFGLAFDPLTGELWDTENGPDSYDEVNLVLPGFNSGWEKIMGPNSRDPQGVGDLVLTAAGSSARQTNITKDTPVDSVIMSVIDSLEVDGEVVFRKS
jgi:hypothetical protein